jgi:hypothetical protein
MSYVGMHVDGGVPLQGTLADWILPGQKDLASSISLGVTNVGSSHLMSDSCTCVPTRQVQGLRRKDWGGI